MCAGIFFLKEKKCPYFPGTSRARDTWKKMDSLYKRFQLLAPLVHNIVVDTRKRRKFDHMSADEAEETQFVSGFGDMGDSSLTTHGVRLEFYDCKWENDEYETFVRNLFRLVRANFAADLFVVECTDDGPAADNLLVLAAAINEARPTTPCIEFENTPPHVIAAFLNCLDDAHCPFTFISIENRDEIPPPEGTHLFDAIEKKALYSKLESVYTNDTRMIWNNVSITAETALIEIEISSSGDDYDVFVLAAQIACNSVTLREFIIEPRIKTIDDRIRYLDDLRRQKIFNYPDFKDEFDTPEKICALVTKVAELTECRRRAHAANPLLLLACAHALVPDSLVAALPFDLLAVVLRAARLA